MSPARGFTLIELLIVISIMAIMGSFAVANYRTFGEDKDLENAALDVVSFIRTAQTNATTNLKCDTQHGAIWQIEYASNAVINLNCKEDPLAITFTDKKQLQLKANIEVDSITGNPSSYCTVGYGSTINFTPINGQIELGGSSNCASLTATLKNAATSNTKNVIMEKGGKIYVQ